MWNADTHANHIVLKTDLTPLLYTQEYMDVGLLGYNSYKTCELHGLLTYVKRYQKDYEWGFQDIFSITANKQRNRLEYNIQINV